jgi:hypothetical protein
MSVRQNVRSAKRPSAKCPFGKMSFGKMSFGKVSFGKMSGYQRKQSLSGILASSEAMEMFVDVDLSSKRTSSGFDLLANQKIMNNMNIRLV